MATQKALKRSQRHFYFADETLDFAAGWLLGYAQQGGMSPGELFYCFNQIKRESPLVWVKTFTEALHYQQAKASELEAQADPAGAAAHHMAAVVAARAILHMLNPTLPEARVVTEAMERAFQAAIGQLGVRLEPWAIPFANGYLPAYVSSDLGSAKTLFVVIGGGDTYREDLWFFGGKAALERGYAVLMPDLPGQGSTPYQGLHFGEATIEALGVALAAVRQRGFAGRVVLCGWSGGGYFTTKFVERSAPAPEIAAWIASTPIHDLQHVFEVAMPGFLRTNPSSWWKQQVLHLAGQMNPVLQAALEKYQWQFGPEGIAGIIEKFADARVNLERLNIPLLALVGESEDAEMIRQAEVVFQTLHARQPASSLVKFSPASGADAHCQINNLPLAQHTIFAWLQGQGL